MIPDIRFLKQTLEDAGCDDRMIGECIKIAETRPSGRASEAALPLPRRPSGTSARKQEQIDCLDFLLYRIRENKF